MPDADILDASIEDVAVKDRRRAGRREVAASLVPMLRSPAGDGVADEWAAREPIAPSKSIVMAVAVCAPVWCAIGALLYAVLR